jgi:hypothetical protein
VNTGSRDERMMLADLSRIADSLGLIAAALARIEAALTEKPELAGQA